MKMSDRDMRHKEAGAIIQMTLEFVKDMDMKMRDVYRVEKIYVRTYDFGAGKMYQDLETYFRIMISLYRNTSSLERLHVDTEFKNLRSQVVGSLQFMLGYYNQFLSTVDEYKKRFRLFQKYSARWEIQDKIQYYLSNLPEPQHPYEWHRTSTTEK